MTYELGYPWSTTNHSLFLLFSNCFSFCGWYCVSRSIFCNHSKSGAYGQIDIRKKQKKLLAFFLSRTGGEQPRTKKRATIIHFSQAIVVVVHGPGGWKLKTYERFNEWFYAFNLVQGHNTKTTYDLICCTNPIIELILLFVCSNRFYILELKFWNLDSTI